MNQFIIYILFLIFMFFQVRAQSSSPSKDNFQPSLVVVIAVLSIMFLLSIILLVYAKYCHISNRHVHNNNQSTLDGLIRSGSQSSGIDKKVVESLPFFRFSLLKGSREGLECAVCLSKFEDIEILRLLPKCKHAFHIDCVDQWLDKHSSCPLCRQKVNIEDLSLLNNSSSLRFLWKPSGLREGSNIDIFVQREDSHKGSSRFCVGNSFRKFEKGKKENELLIQENCEDFDEENGKMLHRFNHKIIISDFVFKNRWSNVSSSDLMFLNSEMIHSISSDRFLSSDRNMEKELERTRGGEEGEIMNTNEEMKKKIEFENKVGKMKFSNLKTNQNNGLRILNTSEKRSLSEITVHPRSKDFNINENIREIHLPEDGKEEKMKRLWYPIARNTAQWFANREERSRPNTSQTLNV